MQVSMKVPVAYVEVTSVSPELQEAQGLTVSKRLRVLIRMKDRATGMNNEEIRAGETLCGQLVFRPHPEGISLLVYLPVSRTGRTMVSSL